MIARRTLRGMKQQQGKKGFGQTFYMFVFLSFLSPILGCYQSWADPIPEPPSPYENERNKGESAICTSGSLYIVDAQVVIGVNGTDHIVSSASSEVCAMNPATFSDVVVQGVPAQGEQQTQIQGKVGLLGTVRINGRTAQMDADVYLPGSPVSPLQCVNNQAVGRGCRNVSFSISFSKTWIFLRSIWRSFYLGPDREGHPVTLLVRLSQGPVN